MLKYLEILIQKKLSKQNMLLKYVIFHYFKPHLIIYYHFINKDKVNIF